MKKFCITIILVSLFLFQHVSARENINQPPAPFNQQSSHRLAGCVPSTALATLDISNVRALILLNGDMWWDAISQTNIAQYEVPKYSGKKSLFAGSIWIGGMDAGNNLYVAAQTYRQTGNDFWPGPLDTTTADVTPTTCLAFDRHYVLTRAEVQAFIDGSPATQTMIDYPGNGTGAQAHYLAPFFDNNGDGIYNTADGDYPKFDYMGSTGADCFNALHGDQVLWFVFNDVGNVHTESSSAGQFGLEIREQAFAYKTPDADINNATFYQYQIINRNPSMQYHNVYIGAWVDADLGNATDDYVGCDVRRGLGYCYNSDNDDEGAQGYGLNPPAVGMDFIHGLLADASDGIDNNRDSVIDEANERIKMSKFVYYNNDFTPHGNPTTTAGYYNLLIGKWLDNSQVTFGGTGYNTGNCATTTSTSFMYPGDSDPYGWGTNGIITQTSNPTCWNWDEAAAGNAPGDRRFLMSAGPITLAPGAVQYMTTAAAWARATTGGPLASVNKLKLADDKLQDFADACFDVSVFYHSTDAGIAAITYPTDSLCDSTFAPAFTLVNFGTNVLTTATINYQLDAGPVQFLNWNGSLNTLDSDFVTLPLMSANTGSHTLTVYTTNPNSTTDQNTANDGTTIGFYIISGMTPPLIEGFETATFPPVNWTRVDPNVLLTRITTAGGFGNSPASMRANGYTLINRTADFISTDVNINGMAAPAYMIFSLAYAPRTDTSSDTLQVYISTDCGSSYTLMYSKTRTALATTTNHPTLYLPLSTEWRKDSVDLSSFVGQSHMRVRFRFRSGDTNHRGNNIYLDDINILNYTLGVDGKNQMMTLNVYPNPSTGKFHLTMPGGFKEKELSIYDITGKEAYSLKQVMKPEMDISISAKGIYFIKVTGSGKSLTTKIVVL